jgi:tRNA G18 (ribose-2'-O)-methylase SpoU
MPIIRITDARDPRILDYRDVPDPELLEQRGLFVAETRMVVRALLASARFRVRSLLLTDATLESLDDALRCATDRLPVYVCSKSLMQPISGFNLHRGCLALGERGVPMTPAELIASLPAARLLVVLEAVTNADNIGGVFRNVAAFAADAVIIGPRCCDPLYRKAIRVSIGATLRIPFASSREWPGDIETLRRSGFTLVALTPSEEAVDLRSFAAGRVSGKLALLVGNEGEGLSPEVQALAHVRVRVPIAAGVDSLNVATATGIALERLWR